MQIRARDSFHCSGVGMFHARSTAEVPDSLGQQLIERGFAEPVQAGETAPPGPEDDPAEREEKMAPPPKNKAAPKPKTKAEEV